MSKKTIVIISVVVNLILLSLVIYYKKEDKRYISKISEKDNISMLKIVGEETEVIKQVPQSGQWSMSYTCDDENAELYWNEKKRTVVAKNISATECTLIFRESDAIFRMISMYVDGEYVTELDETKKYEMESYECTNGEELTWDFQNSKLSIQPISKDTSCYVNFNEKIILPTLTETMLAAEEAQSDVNIDYSKTSEQDGTNGLYYTEENTEGNERVYFYRGAVTNNYVVFGDYCWRIVRTNEDESVRLRYGGTVTANGNSYTCPQTGNSVKIGGKNYVYSENFSDSIANKYIYSYGNDNDIKIVVDNWFLSSGLSVYNDRIANVPFCVDTMNEVIVGSGKSATVFYGASIRLVDIYSNTLKANAKPQYKCDGLKLTVQGDNWNGTGLLTYSIGLLTADEVAYAGGVYDVENTSYYLYTGEEYWTMSPANHSYWNGHGHVFRVGASGNLNSDTLMDSELAVLPVISLKNEAKVKRGTGLYNDPYVINTD